MNVQPLVDRLRATASERRQFGADPGANVLDWAAQQLEQYVEQCAEEPLKLGQAAAESGYTPGHLGRLVLEGSIPNAGMKGSPRIRRRDLPRKPPPRPRRSDSDGPDLARKVLGAQGLVESRRGS